MLFIGQIYQRNKFSLIKIVTWCKTMRMLCMRFLERENLPPNLSAHHSSARLSRVNIDIVSRIFVLQTDPTESRVKSVNQELKELCKRRHIQFLHTFRIFLHKNKPIRSYFAVNDGGLHLNSEGTRRLRLFFINAVSHLK